MVEITTPQVENSKIIVPNSKPMFPTSNNNNFSNSNKINSQVNNRQPPRRNTGRGR